ncbi:MAG: transporter [Gammaproteobacteria bacterium]|nr:transporter [Gammaproteobacteria bacterium]
MRHHLEIWLFALLSSLATPVFAVHPGAWSKDWQEGRWESARPDSHAPIGIMGDHWHNKDGVMLAYRYGLTDMRGLRDGTDHLSTQQVLADFPITPTAMRMEHHMFSMMYAPVQGMTLMLGLPVKQLRMDHLTAGGARFRTDASGIGDLSTAALFVLRETGRKRLHLTLGLSLPTGSIDRSDRTPAGRARLPYPMQLGSGTFDLLPGLTYMQQRDMFSWGGQARATMRLGRNSNNYSLGDSYNADIWISKPLHPEWSASLRLSGIDQDKVDGADPALNPALVPTAAPNLQGRRRADLHAGLNYHALKGALKGHRIAIEFSQPVYQKLNGPQLETDWGLMIGWQYAFKLRRK